MPVIRGGVIGRCDGIFQKIAQQYRQIRVLHRRLAGKLDVGGKVNSHVTGQSAVMAHNHVHHGGFAERANHRLLQCRGKLRQIRLRPLMPDHRQFSDVPSGAWYADPVDFVTARTLFQGTGSSAFSPGGSASRDMLFTVWARLDGQSLPEGGTWYSSAMAWATSTGSSDGSQPNEAITREQLAVMLWRYAGAPAVPGISLIFTDRDKTSGWAEDSIRWAVDKGILTGKDGGHLDPQGNATGAEVSAILERYLKVMQ